MARLEVPQCRGDCDGRRLELDHLVASLDQPPLGGVCLARGGVRNEVFEASKAVSAFGR